MELFHLLIGLSIPMIIAGVIHMVVVRFNLLSFLAKPISTPYFGKNKTWRGFVVMPALGVMGVYVANIFSPDIFTGCSLPLLGIFQGLFYALFELPNSFWKRRKNIGPGKLPDSGKVLHAIVDQADSVIGCGIIYWFFLPVMNINYFLLLLIFGTLVHLFFNFTLYLAGLRKEPL